MIVSKLIDFVIHSYDDSPSIIHPSGSFGWHKDGEWHRENKPAYINCWGDFDIRYNNILIQSFKQITEGSYELMYQKGV